MEKDLNNVNQET